MKTNTFIARVKRSNLEELAGDYFRDETSQIISFLNKQGKRGLVGIQREDSVYTIIGERTIYFATASGNIGEISLKNFSEILHENGISKGKLAKFEFVRINEKDTVWVYNFQVMCALWNIILWLEE